MAKTYAMYVLCAYLIGCCIYVQSSSMEAVYEQNRGSLHGRVVVLDAGHGMVAQGIYRGGRFAGYYEAPRMLVLARFIQEKLESRGATVLMTRESREDVYLAKRPVMMNLWSMEALRQDRLFRLLGEIYYGAGCQLRIQEMIDELSEITELIVLLHRILVNHEAYAPVYMNYPFDHYHETVIHPTWRRLFEFQADPMFRYNWLVISLHSNAGAPDSHNGAIVFYSSNTCRRNPVYFTEYSHVDATRLFGSMLLDGISRIGIRRRSLTSAGFMVIRENNLPSVLVENGHHTYTSDRLLLQCDEFLRRLALVYADTIEAYFYRLQAGG